jgi:hypothetical protein
MIDKKRAAYSWDPLGERWEQVRRLRPGMVLMLDAAAGGYGVDCGFFPRSTDPVPVVEAVELDTRGNRSGDGESEQPAVPLPDHLEHAVASGRRINKLLGSTADVAAIVEQPSPGTMSGRRTGSTSRRWCRLVTRSWQRPLA